MSITVENITKIYGSQKALDHVSFSINEGEIVGLLGPNGAGKSTLMKIISCFIPPTSGNVEVYGNNIFDNPLAIRQNIGYLPEHYITDNRDSVGKRRNNLGKSGVAFFDNNSLLPCTFYAKLLFAGMTAITEILVFAHCCAKNRLIFRI